METTITPRFIEPKTSKAGKRYFQIEDINGTKYTLHEEPLLMHFQIAKPTNADVVISGTWNNIRSISNTPATEKVFTAPQQPSVSPIVEARAAKDTSIYTSYVKDLVVAGKTIEEAIKIVKQAKEAF